MKHSCICMFQLVCLIFCCQSLWCQEDYLQKRQLDAVIYRGPVALKYPFLFRGSVYVFSDEFLQGSVVYNQKNYSGALLNLDAHRDELCIKLPQSGVVIVLSKELVDEFSLGEKRFIKGKWKDTDLENSYCQELYAGNISIVKRVGKDFYLEDGVKPSVYENVKYYLVKENVPYRLKRVESIGKFYRKDIRKKIMRALGQMKVSVEETDEVYRRIGAVIDNL